MKQAKATADDYAKVDRLQTVMDCLTQNHPWFPVEGDEDNDEKTLVPSVAIAKLGSFVTQWWRENSSAWNRVYWTGKMAATAACDPASDVVGWKPQYKDAIYEIDCFYAKPGDTCPEQGCSGTLDADTVCDRCLWVRMGPPAPDPNAPVPAEFEFIAFNPLRAGRGASAAKFYVTVGDTKRVVWMNAKDISANIADYGERPALRAACNAYEAGEWFPARPNPMDAGDPPRAA